MAEQGLNNGLSDSKASDDKHYAMISLCYNYNNLSGQDSRLGKIKSKS